LKDEFSKYTKPDSSIDPFFYYFEDFLGSGIFVQKHGVGSEDDGQEWTKMRKVSAQIFNRHWEDVFLRRLSGGMKNPSEINIYIYIQWYIHISYIHICIYI